MLGVVERTQVASTYLEVRRILFYLSLGIFWISYALQGSSLHQNRGLSTITTISGGLTHLQGSGSGSRPKAKHHQRGVAIEWCLTRSVPQSHREHRHDSVPFDWSRHTITIRGTDCIGSVPIELYHLVRWLPGHLAADEVLAGPLDLRLSELCMAQPNPAASHTEA